MTRIEGETLIGRPPVIVFDFVADQRNEPKFNPRMVRAEMISDPPIGNGSRFVATMKSVGRSADMVIEFTSFERPLRLGSKTRMSWVDIEGGLTFEPHPAGTLMRWSWEVQPKRFTRLISPIILRMGTRQEEAIWGNLKRLLEAGDEPQMA
jgi:Polyketide cyclase / dehydrase and lipid transport